MQRVIAAAAAIVIAGAAASALAQLTERPLTGSLTHPSIGYYTSPTHDLIAKLDADVESGAARLPFDESSGYLRPVLDALHVPVESQMLVMSKTGVQGLYTGPSNPRAIYFNDAVTVGYIRGAPLLELAVHDPRQGVVFYTIDQKPQARPVIERKRACLTCHQVYSTLHVPGMLARSVFVAPDGLPLAQFGSYDADDRTPFRRRWGGWYVTGAEVPLPHIGNAFVTDREKHEAVVSDDTLHRVAASALFDGRGYPSSHSDIAALMVFEHQSHMTNLITRAGWEARMSAAAPETIGELVDYLLFAGEQPLAAPMKGASGFAEAFTAQGPFDSRGRSLRQLDLEHRLLRYPCSYMIYSDAFRALPGTLRSAIFERVWDRLTTRADRRDIVDILRDTVPDLPPVFAR